MPYQTRELRWFVDGALAATGAAVACWFAERPPYGPDGRCGAGAWPAAWRDDRYLVVPGAEDLGIKWREGRLQIKGRLAALGALQLAPGLIGELERWARWSWDGALLEARFAACFRGADTMAVRVDKRRLQRRLRLDANGRATEVPAKTPIDRGLDVELVRLRLNGAARETHWSLGVEAFGASPPLDEVLAGFLDGLPTAALAGGRSSAYPAWLLGVASRCA